VGKISTHCLSLEGVQEAARFLLLFTKLGCFWIVLGKVAVRPGRQYFSFETLRLEEFLAWRE
jgi:hypothetical protein